MIDPASAAAGAVFATGLIMAAAALVSMAALGGARRQRHLAQRVEPVDRPPYSPLARPQVWIAVLTAIQHMAENELDAMDRIADMPPHMHRSALHCARLRITDLIEEARKDAYAAGGAHNCGCVDATAED
jgi:hypothetical protein